jgi:hypothetical protein
MTTSCRSRGGNPYLFWRNLGDALSCLELLWPIIGCIYRPRYRRLLEDCAFYRMTLAAHSSASSSWVRPSSARISAVCWPSVGAGRRITPGVCESLTG